MNELPGKFLKRSDYAQYKRQHFMIIAPVGVHPDDFLRPQFWVNHVGALQHRDVIEIIAEDDSYEMTLRVRGFLTVQNGAGGSMTTVGVYMRELDRKMFGDLSEKPTPAEKEEPKQVGNLTITWGGPAHKFRILEGTRLISKGHKDRGAAEKAAQDYLAKLEAVA